MGSQCAVLCVVNSHVWVTSGPSVTRQLICPPRPLVLAVSEMVRLVWVPLSFSFSFSFSLLLLASTLQAARDSRQANIFLL